MFQVSFKCFWMNDDVIKINQYVGQVSQRVFRKSLEHSRSVCKRHSIAFINPKVSHSECSFGIITFFYFNLPVATLEVYSFEPSCTRQAVQRRLIEGQHTCISDRSAVQTREIQTQSQTPILLPHKYYIRGPRTVRMTYCTTCQHLSQMLSDSFVHCRRNASQPLCTDTQDIDNCYM